MARRNAHATAAKGRKAGPHSGKKRPVEDFDPFDHMEDCPDHGITNCATCHVVAGECDSGGCFKPATVRITVTRVETGQVAETRPFCDSPTCQLLYFQSLAGLGVKIDVEPLT